MAYESRKLLWASHRGLALYVLAGDGETVLDTLRLETAGEDPDRQSWHWDVNLSCEERNVLQLGIEKWLSADYIFVNPIALRPNNSGLYLKPDGFRKDDGKMLIYWQYNRNTRRGVGLDSADAEGLWDAIEDFKKGKSNE